VDDGSANVQILAFLFFGIFGLLFITLIKASISIAVGVAIFFPIF